MGLIVNPVEAVVDVVVWVMMQIDLEEELSKARQLRV
jgi:hypothetical protein